MKVIGLCALAHDPTACLVTPKGIVAAIEEERLSRRKGAWGFPEQALKKVLDIGGIAIEDVDAVAYYWDDVGQFGRVALDLVRQVGPLGVANTGALLLRRAEGLFARCQLRRELQRVFDLPKGKLPPIVCVAHHDAHVAAGLLASPFEADAALVIDGRGETAATSIYRIRRTARGQRCFEVVETIAFPHSLGVFYGAVTQLLGYRALLDEYKVMGLAPYGRADEDLRRRVEQFLSLDSNGRYSLNLSFLASTQCDRPDKPWLNERGLELLDGNYRQGDVFTQRGRNLAFEAQERLNKAMEGLLRRLVALTGARRPIITGGVAMNGRGINHLRSTGLVEDIYVPLAPYDAGTALGAAVSLMLRRDVKFDEDALLPNAYLGPGYSDEEIRRVLVDEKCRFEHPSELETVVAEEIAAGKIVGWFQGRMEFGQRALGARSILADPRTEARRDQVNALIKQRESFRPLAPSVLEECAPRYFALTSNRFMNEVVAATERACIQVPAVVHVDQTARPQTVPKDCPVPRYRKLIERFSALTGTPMLLNTSFNVAGEPMVCSPHDALRCFFRSGLDLLAIGPFVLRREQA